MDCAPYRAAAGLCWSTRAGELDIERAGDAAGARGHDDDLVREINGLVHVVRYHDGGHAGLFPDAQDLILHIHAGEGIECTERLVEQKHLGPADRGACERGALAHAARKLMRIGLLEALEADHFDELIDAVLFLLVDAAGTQAEGDIVVDGQPRDQRVLLEHEAAVGAGSGDGHAVERQLALVHWDETGDQTQERRFAAAGRADERHERAGGDFERHIVERDDAFSGWIDKVLGDARNGDASYHHDAVKAAGAERRGDLKVRVGDGGDAAARENGGREPYGERDQECAGGDGGGKGDQHDRDPCRRGDRAEHADETKI